AQTAEILKLKTRIKKLEKKCKPSISHHRAWLRSVSILSMKKKLGKKESVSKQGRKNAKPGPNLDGTAFNNLDADGMDYIDTEEAVNEGRHSKETEELNELVLLCLKLVLLILVLLADQKMTRQEAGEDTSKKEKVLEEPDSTKMEVKQEEVEVGTRKRPSTILKMKARKKARI
ncbi:hypothetical protein Tco_1520817, partial [Tanacetum coccineum]